jgi:hypothetical protein
MCQSDELNELVLKAKEAKSLVGLMGQGSKGYICWVCVGRRGGGSHTNIESDPHTQMGREIERESPKILAIVYL